MTLNLNDAQPSQFDTIPDGTPADVIMKLRMGEGGSALHQSKKSDIRFLNVEFTIVSDKYRGRKFFSNMNVETGDTHNEGHKTAIEITRSLLRSIVEAAKGIAPTDETPAAIKARTLSSYDDLDGLQFSCIIGVEPGKDGYADKNKIARVINPMATQAVKRETTTQASKAPAPKW